MPQRTSVFVLVLLSLGCEGAPSPPDAAAAPDAWSVSLVGHWAQPPPYNAVMRFDGDGSQRVARTRADLESAPLASGTWELAGDRLILTNTVGACSTPPANQVGVYDIALSDGQVTFTLVSDACPERLVIAGETWTRLP